MRKISKNRRSELTTADAIRSTLNSGTTVYCSQLREGETEESVFQVLNAGTHRDERIFVQTQERGWIYPTTVFTKKSK